MKLSNCQIKLNKFTLKNKKGGGFCAAFLYEKPFFLVFSVKKLDFSFKNRYTARMKRSLWARFIFLILIGIWLTGCSVTQFERDIIVRKGDTLYSLSQKYGVPMRDVIEANNLRAPYTLKTGQRLIVPYAKTHTVRASETLYSISRKYGMSVQALARQNNLRAPYTLHVGQKLRVSSVTTSHGTESPIQRPSQSAKTTRNTKKAARTQSANFNKNISVPKNQRGKTFAYPAQGKIISDFGSKGHGQHNDGINISGRRGDPIRAAESGTVAYAGNELKGYGNLILIKHKNGWITAYAHNDKLFVKKGQSVKKGQKIATMGSTGNAKTPQLHFEIRYKTKVVNPRDYLK